MSNNLSINEHEVINDMLLVSFSDGSESVISLKKLRDIGNSIIVIEHDKDTMLSSDYIIDIGPKAGKLGGEIIFSGNPGNIYNSKKSGWNRIKCVQDNFIV